jgi:hypothetical protein
MSKGERMLGPLVAEIGDPGPINEAERAAGINHAGYSCVRQIHGNSSN